MKLTHKIIKLLFSLCVILIAQNVFGQREIQSYEDMFTYDYALKYCLNLPIIEEFPDYWFLENFKAPAGIKSIEMYPYDDRVISKRYPTGTFKIKEQYISTKDFKVIHIYDPKNGFLKKTLLFPLNESIKNNDSILYKTYNYKIDEKHILIDVSYPNSEDMQAQYLYKKKTNNLVHIINNKRDTVYFSYKNTDIENFDLTVMEIKSTNIHYQITDSIFKNNSENYLNYTHSQEFYNNSNNGSTWLLTRKLHVNSKYVSSSKTEWNDDLISLNIETEYYRQDIKLKFASNKTINNIKIERNPVLNWGNNYLRIKKYLGLWYNEVKTYSPTSDMSFSLIKKSQKMWQSYMYGLKKTNSERSTKTGRIKIKKGNIYQNHEPLIIYN
ncbi:hypothetical protein [Flavobacterium sp. NKUCC04_CG]|uniref:hypothetical protein n=1 Tax=Flavobacterium sp. NKUCC04_CG TaxID=2842121 RepID=UPI001C5B98A9|nr:hypothetical protein [Flavobacterium sp. NKUCC04_CG]MBW3518638.1 hypothetical protein [Flavobacterium sp. NKUCC04_CG]